MARLLGPDAGSRYAYLPSGAPAAGLPAVVYSNSAGTVLADIQTYDGTETPAGTILGSAVTTDAAGQLPLFWFPDPLVDQVYVSVNGGPVFPVDADNNRRFDLVVREGPLSLKDPRVGAALDGSNEAAKLTAATALLPAGGGEILVPPGVLGLGSEVTLPANVSLTGTGLLGSSIRPAGGYTGRLLSTGVAARVSHLNFDGLSTAGTLLTVRGARTMLSQLYLQNGAADGIEFVGTSAGTSAHAAKVTDVNIIGCAGRGVMITSFAYDQQFSNVWIGQCNVGLRTQDSAGVFTNLHVWGCTGNGVEVRGEHNRFMNVYLETNGAGGTGSGIDIFNITNTRVIGGALWKNNTVGANVSTANRTLLQGLAIYENNTNGVSGANSLYCQVVGNQFHDIATPARQDRPIVTSGTSDWWIVAQNVMRTADHVVGASTFVGANNVVVNNIV